MKDLIEYLTSVHVAKLASNPWVLLLAAAVFLVAAVMRWKFVLLLLFAVGGMLAVARYATLGEAHGPLDASLLIFVSGSLVVGGVLIYYLFIRGD